ncbi:probable serine/threonine-protein kinase kinX isoform X2 [Venturia canescens]|uniref:probable serine/threonine-protein kinase kinX isoform X2 n=1 Tax=Venturia canescens TaxID=32260 RepID=UPI001C9C34B9|nr:probable serine/threonine-protein kinase kinX isoform X2 [Venturia canescens]
MSTAGERPLDENPNINTIKNDEGSPSKNVSETETEPAMLDEEEMPSYISLNSLPNPDESRAEQNVPQQSQAPTNPEERASSPYQSEQGAESVCVLSSGEESDRRPYAMEDYDSEEMDMEDEEEEVDEEEEEDDSCMNDEEESDGDIEPEQFERSSDDFNLRYDSGLEKHHKERSRSLQDLTNSRGNLSRFVGKRRSIDLMGSYESQFIRQPVQPPEDPLSLRKKMPRSIMYDHIPSKVKQYIQEMKEQRRRSAERINRENSSQKNFSETISRVDNAEVQRAAGTILNPESKRMKSYAEHAIHEIKTEERNFAADARYTEHPTIEEHEEFREINKINETKIDKDIYDMETNQIPENLTMTTESLSKKLRINGLVEYNDKVIEPSKLSEANGEQQIATILNLRTLSYEEYTNGNENSEGVVENLSRPKVPEKNALDCTEKSYGSVIAEPEIQKTSSTSKKEDEKSSQIPTKEAAQPRNNWNLRELTLDDSSRRKVAQVDSEVYQKMLDENVNLKLEIEEMKQTLEQCRLEYQPKEEYQKVLAENASLRHELQEMENKFEQYRAEHTPAETKVASVQTEIYEEKMDVSENLVKQTASTNKVLTSTATSAQSSIEQWSDSNYSAAISIDPPNIEAALDADDSLATTEKTNTKPPHTLSQSFITSSRILQTLANITQGRTKPTGVSPNFTTEKTQLEPKDPTHITTEQRAEKNLQQPNKHPDENNPRRSDDPDVNEESPDTLQNVKYYVYHDEPDVKERSFLIQAKDSSVNTETIDKGGNVRECGPFLLGNVEIRMSETNDTINIWGKELNHQSEEAEAQNSSVFSSNRSYTYQSTPYMKCFNQNTLTCPSMKKPRISPKFSRSGIGKYFRSAATNLTRTMSNPGYPGHFARCANSSLADLSRTSSCEHCEAHQKQTKISSYEHLANFTAKHSCCCLQNPETNERVCDDGSDNEVFDDSTVYETMSNILANHEKYTSSFNNLMAKHFATNVTGEEKHRNHTSPGPRVHEQDSHRTNKRCSSCTDDLPSCSRRLAPPNRQCRDDHPCRSHSHPSCDDDDRPLLFNQSPSETPEIKRRRLSGKKVRGILTDLLRGCSGCRDPNSTSNLPNASVQNAIPKVYVTPCEPVVPSCSKHKNASSTHQNHNPSNETVKERCCSSCSRPSEVRTQIENELEIFHVAMEQLLTHSHALLEKFNQLKASTD